MGSSYSTQQAQLDSLQRQLNLIAKQIDQLARNQRSSSAEMRQFMNDNPFRQNVNPADGIEVSDGMKSEKCTPMVLLLPSEKLGLEDINPVENEQAKMANQMSRASFKQSIMNIANEMPNIFG